jgi:AbrB family looped-hinge helix DNA binding protein
MNCRLRPIAPRLNAPTLPKYSYCKVNQKEIATMFVKITAKRQVTFPARVLEALGVKPGDRIELEEGPDGFVLRARHIDRARLAPLRGKLRRGKGTFDLEAFRNKPHDRTLRD